MPGHDRKRLLRRNQIPFGPRSGRNRPGAKIGLEVQVNDSDNVGKRDTKLCWRDKDDSAWKNPQAFGNAELAGLVGWWKFDETQGTTAKDSSGGNHAGKLVGNAKFSKGKAWWRN